MTLQLWPPTLYVLWHDDWFRNWENNRAIVYSFNLPLDANSPCFWWTRVWTINNKNILQYRFTIIFPVCRYKHLLFSSDVCMCVCVCLCVQVSKMHIKFDLAFLLCFDFAYYDILPPYFPFCHSLSFCQVDLQVMDNGSFP